MGTGELLSHITMVWISRDSQGGAEGLLTTTQHQPGPHIHPAASAKWSFANSQHNATLHAAHLESPS